MSLANKIEKLKRMAEIAQASKPPLGRRGFEDVGAHMIIDQEGNVEREWRQLFLELVGLGDSVDDGTGRSRNSTDLGNTTAQRSRWPT